MELLVSQLALQFVQVIVGLSLFHNIFAPLHQNHMRFSPKTFYLYIKIKFLLWIIHFLFVELEVFH